jgi:D-amino-acid dehydrogenase
MRQQETIAVIGAGIVGAAVAYALAREGRKVLLIDRADPGEKGASYGNVGHVATEWVQPLPSPALLFGFWRQLIRFGGVLDLPARQALGMGGWIRRFAIAAFRRDRNTTQLAPLVRPAARDWARWISEIGEHSLLKTNGHYEVSFGSRASRAVGVHAAVMQTLGVPTQQVQVAELKALCEAAGATQVAALWYPESAHILDPLGAVRAFVRAALNHGAEFRRFDVHGLTLSGGDVEISGAEGTLRVDAAVVCAGVRSRELLKPLGVNAPLVAARGYHLEVPGGMAFFDAPVVYNDAHLVVTPMAGRIRASTFMEFLPLDAPPDPKKTERLRREIRNLGYGEPTGAAWVGGRPVLPDYLPGIGRAPHAANLFYAVGHQHIGLTLAPVTGDLIADLVAGRAPRHPVNAFDLGRFGRGI